MLGIAGDSASGRTTLTRGIVRVLGQNGVTPICLDDYYRYSRAERAARGLTALDPSATNLELMTRHLAMLRDGEPISKPVYDHRTGDLRGPEQVVATDLVIAYGLLTLATPELTALFDLMVYLDPDSDLHRSWMLQRDAARRGYTLAAVQPQQRERDAERYIKPQRQHANLVVRFFPPEDVPPQQADPCRLHVRIGQRCHPHRPNLPATLTALCNGAEPPGQRLTLQEGIIDADGHTIDQLTYTSAPERWFEHPLLDQLGAFTHNNSEFHSDSLALTQLLIIHKLGQIRRT